MNKIISLIWLTLFALISCQAGSQVKSLKEDAVNVENAKIVAELNDLAKTVGYEFVYGDYRYPINNGLGSSGTSYIFDIFTTRETRSVLFLCRKPSQFYKKKNTETVRELEFFYDYALIFAIKDSSSNSNYKIHSVINKDIGLKGLNLHYGPLDKDLSEFTNVKDPSQKGPKGKFADYRSGAMPIIISSDAAYVVLYYYNGEWFEYIERDE